MFIVAMTMGVIGAMGLYALNMASAEVKTSGFVRQQLQTQYLSQFGTQAAAQALGGLNTQVYYSLVTSPTPDTGCLSLEAVYLTAAGAAAPTAATCLSKTNSQSCGCHRAASAELGSQMNSVLTGVNGPISQWGHGGSAAANRGSLGLPLLDEFFVEVTDPNPRQPPAGYATNTQNPLCFVQFTVSSFGVTPYGTPPAPPTIPYTGRLSEGFEMARSRVLGGPVSGISCN
jgi:hypothetical protein